jgi:DNA primase catalytic subunit
MFGNPIQVPVYNSKELSYKIDVNNGCNDCYLSICCFSEKGINPLFFPIDLDGDHAKEDAKKILEFLNDYDLNYYFIFSGSKGYHFQIPLIGFNRKPSFVAFTQYLRKTLKLKSIDVRVSQDTRRLMRIPGTINTKSGNLCYVIEEYHEGVHLAIDCFVDIPFSEDPIRHTEVSRFNMRDSINVTHSYPCVERLIRLEEPPHIIRLAFVVLRANAGFSASEIFEELKSFNWRDFNSRFTSYQIGHIVSRGYGISCSMLKDYCLKEECSRHVSYSRKNRKK